jgi:CRISPR-associated DxTHG motif protein
MLLLADDGVPAATRGKSQSAPIPAAFCTWFYDTVIQSYMSLRAYKLQLHMFEKAVLLDTTHVFNSVPINSNHQTRTCILHLMTSMG